MHLKSLMFLSVLCVKAERQEESDGFGIAALLSPPQQDEVQNLKAKGMHPCCTMPVLG